MNIARYEKRIFAYLIDYLFPILIGVLAFLLLKNHFSYKVFDIFVIINWFIIITYWIIYIPILFLFNGNTLGSLIFGIKVIPLKAEKITFKISLIRALTLSIPMMVIINVFYMLVVHSERTIFDILSESIVINKE